MPTTAATSLTAAAAYDDGADRPKFVPGTIGWTAADLDDPEIERLWFDGRYEIVEGVLTQMPAAYLDSSGALIRLVTILMDFTKANGVEGQFAVETDLVLNPMRVPRADAIFMTAEALRRQEAENAASKLPRGRYGRVRVMPTLVMESVSPGHEAHDRKTKRQWYAEARIPHYWILDAFDRSMECLLLDGAGYRTEWLGRDGDEVRPSLFPGLVIPVSRLWL
jgi:Uma2 family endonuclease